jgi:sugar-specific transcriptional regulator TrmB
MDSHLTSCLRQLGCSPKEIRFFIANYTLGPASLAAIAKKARLQRSTTYLLADDLIQKRLVAHDHREYNKLFVAASPEALMRMLDTKQRSIARTSLTLKENLSELQAAYTASEILPKVTIHQGTSGLSSILRDILGSSTEILLWTNQATEQEVFEPQLHQDFIAQRIKRRTPIRVLAVDNTAGQALIESDERMLRSTRILPASATFTAETYIYEDKVVILDFNTDIFGIIIRNPSVTAAQKAIFELQWQQADLI